MRYDVSFYQDNIGQQTGDVLLYPLTAKSDKAILELACNQAKQWNKRYGEEPHYKYITIYRYVPQRCGWKTIIDKYKIF